MRVATAPAKKQKKSRNKKNKQNKTAAAQGKTEERDKTEDKKAVQTESKDVGESVFEDDSGNQEEWVVI